MGQGGPPKRGARAWGVPERAQLLEIPTSCSCRNTGTAEKPGHRSEEGPLREERGREDPPEAQERAWAGGLGKFWRPGVTPQQILTYPGRQECPPCLRALPPVRIPFSPTDEVRRPPLVLVPLPSLPSLLMSLSPHQTSSPQGRGRVRFSTPAQAFHVERLLLLKE